VSYHYPSNSVYANDPRVSLPYPSDPCFLLVQGPAGQQWSVNAEADYWLIGDADGRLNAYAPVQYATGDDAIRSLIGDPQ